MRRHAFVVVASMLVVAVGVGLQPAAADEKWPGHCGETETIEPGVHGGTLSPRDQDSFKVNVPEGDFITLKISWDTEAIDDLFIMDDFTRDLDDDTPAEAREQDGESSEFLEQANLSTASFADTNESVIDNNIQEQLLFDENSGVTIRVYSEGPGPICLGLATSDGAGDWQISFAINDAKPPECNATGGVNS